MTWLNYATRGAEREPAFKSTGVILAVQERSRREAGGGSLLLGLYSAHENSQVETNDVR